MTEYVIKPTTGPNYLPDTYALLRVDHCKGAVVEYYGSVDYLLIQFRNLTQTGDTLRIDKGNPERDALVGLTTTVYGQRGGSYCDNVTPAGADQLILGLRERGYKIVKDDSQ